MADWGRGVVVVCGDAGAGVVREKSGAGDDGGGLGQGAVVAADVVVAGDGAVEAAAAGVAAGVVEFGIGGVRGVDAGGVDAVCATAAVQPAAGAMAVFAGVVGGGAV